MDVVLPGMNGFQATRALSRDVDTSHIPVLIVSTKGLETDRVWGLRQGAKDHRQAAARERSHRADQRTAGTEHGQARQAEAEGQAAGGRRRRGRVNVAAIESVEAPVVEPDAGAGRGPGRARRFDATPPSKRWRRLRPKSSSRPCRKRRALRAPSPRAGCRRVRATSVRRSWCWPITNSAAWRTWPASRNSSMRRACGAALPTASARTVSRRVRRGGGNHAAAAGHPVPGAQPWMLGVANVRGTLLPVVDLKQFLEGERTVLHEGQRVLVVRQPGGDVAVTIDELYGQRSFVDGQHRTRLGVRRPLCLFHRSCLPRQ
jgi:hypothetical protein